MEIISNSPYFLFVPKSTTESHFTEVYLSATDIFSFWVFPGLSILTFLSSLSTQLAVTAECKNIVVSNLHCCCSCSCWPACQGEMGNFPLPFTCICLLSLSLSLSFIVFLAVPPGQLYRWHCGWGSLPICTVLLGFWSRRGCVGAGRTIEIKTFSVAGGRREFVFD